MFKRLQRIVSRSYYYFKIGYSHISFPFAFLGYSASIYYLAVENIPFLKRLFPSFSDFLLVGCLSLFVVGGILGYLYMKRLWFYRVSQEVQMEANPYAYKLPVGRVTVLQPYIVLGARMNLKLWDRLGILSEEEKRKWLEYIHLLEYLRDGGDLRNLNKKGSQ